MSGNQRAVATEPSFPRKWESRTSNLKKPFYPISFRADRSGFPPARE
ncbi:pilS cassette protein [Neisseria gonorrhoeae]